MKHRKDWTAWKAKRESQLREQRETNRVILRMLQEQIDSMHMEGGLLARLMAPKPMLFMGGNKIVFPVIYREK